MDIGQLRVGKGYFMVTVGQQGQLKENLTELHIIVRTTGVLLVRKSSFQMEWIEPVHHIKMETLIRRTIDS